MTKRISRKALIGLADINATRATGATYFPFPEYVTKVAYSCNAAGWTGSLYKGTESGLLYAVTDMGNDCASNGCHMRRMMGNREKYVVRTLSHVEELEHDHEKSVIRFVSRDGEHAFTAVTFDFGRTWTICG